MVSENFGFCCKLDKGTFIWGILSIMFYASILIITTKTWTINEESEEKVISYDYNNYNVTIFGYGDSNGISGKSTETIFMVSTIHLISSVSLTLGAVLVCLLFYKHNF